MNQPCPRCLSRTPLGKNWDEPRCAFPTGVFQSDNWNCATANALRDLVKQPVWNEDQNAGLIPGVKSYHVVLGWYKNRGRTEGAWMINEGIMEPLTLEEAERVIEAAKQ